MKNILKMFGVITLALITGFAFMACPDAGSGDNGKLPEEPGGKNTPKAEGAVVDVPTLASTTSSSITINAVTAPANGQTVEYGLSASNSASSVTSWQTTLVFSGLNPETTYYIFARSKENDNYSAGTASTALHATTDAEAITVQGITITGTVHTYNGSPQGVTIGYAEGETAFRIGAFDVEYKGIGETNYSVSATPPTNAGTYEILLNKGAGQVNTEILDRAVVGTLHINPAPLTFTVSAADTGFNPFASSTNVTFTVSGFIPADSSLTTTISLSQAAGFTFADTTTKSGTLSYSGTGGAGQTLTFKANAAGGNYAEASDTLSITFNDGSEQKPYRLTSGESWTAAMAKITSDGSGSYFLNVDGDFSVAGNTPGFFSTDRTFGTVDNLTVTLKGSGIVSLSSSGSLFNIGGRLRYDSVSDSDIPVSVNQTLIIDSASLTLKGTVSNSGFENGIVRVFYGGKLELKNGTISDNGGVGVSFVGSGTFTMSGGTISDNSYGGVYIGRSSTFTMSGGTISGNNGYYGGGVDIYSSTFTMSGGTISGNTGFYGGGVAVRGSDTDGSSTFTMSAGTISDNVRGVYVGYNSTFNMSGTAVISGNTSTSSGGGVYVSGIDSNYFDTSKAGKFNMSGGTISGNTAYDSTYDVSGGGVLVTGGGSFTMTNGTISGNTANDRGGGVYVVSRRPTNPTQSNPSYTSTFTKTGGTIYGNSGDANANTANRTSGAKGHAAYYYMATDATTTDLYRDTTLGVGDNINTTDTVTGWNQ